MKIPGIIELSHDYGVGMTRNPMSAKRQENSVLTISRRMGSGAMIIAEKLAQETGWQLWDKELIHAMASNARVSSEVAEKFDERKIGEFSILVKGLIGDYETASFLPEKHLSQVIKAIAKIGNAIIIGRGANFILPDALNVRIDASDDVRIANMMKFEGLTYSEAKQRISASDRERHEFLVNIFGKTRVKNEHYDITLWMDKFDTDYAAAVLKSAIEVKFGAVRKR